MHGLIVVMLLLAIIFLKCFVYKRQCSKMFSYNLYNKGDIGHCLLCMYTKLNLVDLINNFYYTKRCSKGCKLFLNYTRVSRISSLYKLGVTAELFELSSCNEVAFDHVIIFLHSHQCPSVGQITI